MVVKNPFPVKEAPMSAVPTEPVETIEPQPAIVRVNIPFVSRSTSFIPGHTLTGDRAARTLYLDALEQEARAVAPDAASLAVAAFRLDGPMPSVLSPDHLGRLTKTLHQAFSCTPSCTTTLVAAPQTVGTASLTGWTQGAINRVELLVDSLEPDELARLERPFNVNDIQNALLFLDKFHIGNVGVRLIVGTPGQQTPALLRGLRSLAGVGVSHFTLAPYSHACLGRTEGTALEEENIAAARGRLREYGYLEYLPGLFAHEERFRDTFAVLQARQCPEIGLGIDARSCFGGLSCVNTDDYTTYVSFPDDPSKTVVAVETVESCPAG